MTTTAKKVGSLLTPAFTIADLVAGEIDVSGTVTAGSLEPYGDIRIQIDPSANPAVGDILLDVYLIRTINSVQEDYDINDNAEGFLPAGAYVGSCIANDAADHTAKDYIIRDVELPPAGFKVGVKNRDSTGLSAAPVMNISPWQYETT